MTVSKSADDYRPPESISAFYSHNSGKKTSLKREFTISEGYDNVLEHQETKSRSIGKVVGVDGRFPKLPRSMCYPVRSGRHALVRFRPSLLSKALLVSCRDGRPYAPQPSFLMLSERLGNRRLLNWHSNGKKTAFGNHNHSEHARNVHPMIRILRNTYGASDCLACSERPARMRRFMLIAWVPSGTIHC